MLEKKLIFLDIDGTILAPHEEVRPIVKDALRRAKDNGNQIFLCTGRSHWNVPKELNELEWDGIIASAGSDIWIHGKNVFRTALDISVIDMACKTLEQIQAIYILEGYEYVYLSEKAKKILIDEELLADNSPEMIRRKQIYRRRKNVKNIEEWKEEQALIPKITFIVRSKRNKDYLKKSVKHILEAALFQRENDNFYYGELISPEHNKWAAICRLVEMIQGNLSQVVAFGDSMNDYQMIQQAAYGIAMGNSDTKLKAAATRVCETVQEDGVVRELERMHII